MFSKALESLGLARGSTRDARQIAGIAGAHEERRELAATMRALPGRFAGRLSAGMLERITVAVAAGRWEEAVEDLITALHARAEAVTDQERNELRAACEAMNMDGERVGGLLRRSRPATSAGSLSSPALPAEADPDPR